STYLSIGKCKLFFNFFVGGRHERPHGFRAIRAPAFLARRQFVELAQRLFVEREGGHLVFAQVIRFRLGHDTDIARTDTQRKRDKSGWLWLYFSPAKEFCVLAR